jgi:hypothetical protein
LKQFLEDSPLVEARSGRVLSHFADTASKSETIGETPGRRLLSVVA